MENKDGESRESRESRPPIPSALIFFILAVALFVGAAYGSLKLDSSSPSPPSSYSATATATLDQPDRASATFELTTMHHGMVTYTIYPDGQTNAFALLSATLGKDLQWQDFPGLGPMVTGIMGDIAGPGEYWEFLVNGKSAEVGAGSYIVQDGDRLGFRLSRY